MFTSLTMYSYLMRQFVGGEKKILTGTASVKYVVKYAPPVIVAERTIVVRSPKTFRWIPHILVKNGYEYKPPSSFPNSIKDNVQTYLLLTTDSLFQTS